LNFDPGAVGNTLTVGSDGTNPGALIQSLFDTVGLCGAGGCNITGGYLTLTSGGYLGGGGCSGGNCSYTFGAGGAIDVFGTVTTSLGTSSGHLFSATFTTGDSFHVAGTVGTFAGGLSIPSITFFGPAFGKYTFTGGSGDAITISLNTNCSGGGKCTGLVDQASASVQTTTIAEPATMSVLGTGLLALGTGLRRKFAKA